MAAAIRCFIVVYFDDVKVERERTLLDLEIRRNRVRKSEEDSACKGCFDLGKISLVDVEIRSDVFGRKPQQNFRLYFHQLGISLTGSFQRKDTLPSLTFYIIFFKQNSPMKVKFGKLLINDLQFSITKRPGNTFFECLDVLIAFNLLKKAIAGSII